MDEMSLLRERAAEQPGPRPEVVASALGRLQDVARRPRRGPRVWSAWSAARPRRARGLVAALVAGVVVVAGVTTMAVRGSGGDAVLMASTGGGFLPEWREGDPEIAVFLCEDDSPYPNCGGGGFPEDDGQGPPPDPVGGGEAYTPEQRAAVARALTAMPQVAAVFFVTRQEAYADFRRRFPLPKMAVFTEADMYESFTLKLKDGADGEGVVEVAARLPGVSGVVDRKCTVQNFLELVLGKDRDRCRSGS
jgi:hypothetical protein